MTTTESFLLALLAIFTLPYLAWRLARTDTHVPLVVVQILAGVLLGPGLLGGAFPDVFGAVFTPAVVAALNGLAWWGITLFVFLAGLELDPADAWAHRRETGITAGLALLVPLLTGSAAAALLVLTPGWTGPMASEWQAVLGIGMACAVTALPILLLLMERMGILRDPLGQRLLRYASLDDVAIWGVLALILLDWQRIERQALFLAGFALAAWLLRRLMARLPESDRWYLAFGWLALCGFAADWAGLHFMVGGFLAGVVLDTHWFNRDRLDSFRHLLLLAVTPVYFLSTGLKTQWGMGGVAVLGAAALLLVASVTGKLLGVRLAARVLGWPKGEATVIGWLLQTKALIMIIFANVLLDRQIISADCFTALLLMALASTVLTTPMVRRALARQGQQGAR